MQSILQNGGLYMINIMLNNLYRTLSKKNRIFISLLMTAVSIFFAVYFTAKLQVRGNVAIITDNGLSFQNTKYINFTVLKNVPPKSELVLNKYDAIVIDKGNGNYEIETIKSNEYKEMLTKALINPQDFVPENKDTRGVGTNIIGYLLMFLMLQGILFMESFSEDKEGEQIKRIAASPISFFKYLSGNFMFTFLFIFLPTYIFLIIISKLLGIEIGFTLFQYLLLLFIACMLSTGFSMFLNSLVKTSDDANMIGSAITILSTILSGSFYSFDKANKFLDALLWLLPQKDFLSFVQGLENGKDILSILPQIIYVLIIVLLFLMFSIIKNRHDYLSHI